jgi:nitroreductase
MMTYNKLLINRRSVRKYQDKPVSLALVKEMIKESTFAPSAGNGQPWKFIVVHDREMMKKISDESKKNILNRINANPGDPAEKYRHMLENTDFNVFYNAPCVVMILGNSDQKNLYVDCALAACYFMTSATARGLGTCWVNLGTEIHDPVMVDRLGIPDNLTIVAPIALGYPEHLPAAPKRKEPEILKIIA